MPTCTPAELAKRHLEKEAAKKGKTIVEVELPNTKKMKTNMDGLSGGRKRNRSS
jgi:hypothetical protein